MPPTLGDVLRHIFSLRKEHTTRRKPKPLNEKEVFSTVAKDVKDLSVKAPTPHIIGEKSLRKKIVEICISTKGLSKLYFSIKLQN